MGLDKARLKEIADDVFTTLKRRPRLTFLAACLLVLLISAWGTQRFADRLLSRASSRCWAVAWGRIRPICDCGDPNRPFGCYGLEPPKGVIDVAPSVWVLLESSRTTARH